MRVRYNQTTTEITLKNEQLFMNGWVKVVKKERDVGTKLFFRVLMAVSPFGMESYIVRRLHQAPSTLK
jgi:hypothetical protein